MKAVTTLLAFLLTVSPALAQSTLGTIRGVVTDPSGATVAGVSVVVRNIDTNIPSPATSNDDDFFSYGVSTQARGSVTPGRYQLIIPTGDKASSTNVAGVTPISQGNVNAVAVDLASPPVMNYVDSWAAIVE